MINARHTAGGVEGSKVRARTSALLAEGETTAARDTTCLEYFEIPLFVMTTSCAANAEESPEPEHTPQLDGTGIIKDCARGLKN